SPQPPRIQCSHLRREECARGVVKESQGLSRALRLRQLERAVRHLIHLRRQQADLRLWREPRLHLRLGMKLRALCRQPLVFWLWRGNRLFAGARDDAEMAKSFVRARRVRGTAGHIECGRRGEDLLRLLARYLYRWRHSPGLVLAEVLSI